MTNPIAIFLGIAILGFFALDYFVLHWDAPLIVMRVLIDLIDRLAVWR